MNVDRILTVFNQSNVDYLLIGGMNFFLRHVPVTTFDVDFWIRDTPENRRHCEIALASLAAQWGRDDADWGSVAAKPPGWLESQAVFCLNSPAGAIDIFRSLHGLASWSECRQRATTLATAAGTRYHSLADVDMLACQLALPEHEQKQDRIRVLRHWIALERDRHEA